MSVLAKIPVRPQRKAPDECPPGVRVATRADEAALYDLVLKGVANEMATAPVNEAKVRQLIQEVTRPAVSINIPRPAVMVIDHPNGSLAGAAPLIPKRWWYSDAWHYIQPWIFVREEFRKGPFTRALLETVVWWGDKSGLPVLMSVPADSSNAGRLEQYARYAEPFGGSFIHAGGGAPTERPVNVRVGHPEDYKLVLDLCLLLNLENASAPLRADQLDEVIRAGLAHNNGVILIVNDPDGKPVGCACLALDQWDYSLSWHYSEMWVFVHPLHRKGSYAKDILQFCKWWAEQTGLPVTMGIMSRKRTKAKLRLYSRHLKPLEYFFIRAPKVE